MASAEQKEKKILIIEDDQVYRSLLISTLRKAGFQCTFCIEGDLATKKLMQEKFDLLISDYLLPGTNGVEIIRLMRKQGIDIPALIVTNYPSELLHISNKALGRTKIMAKASFLPDDMPKIVLGMMN
ncbi:MAG: response regulator [Ignavibacteriae bacterium]|nr:MAG: response regulator [Ignavibacteriota bacterium]